MSSKSSVQVALAGLVGDSLKHNLNYLVGAKLHNNHSAPPALQSYRVETDRIRTDTNSNVTVYYMLLRIQIQIRISSDTNTKRIVESEFLFRYLLNSTQTIYPKI
jgi:hypothetical protein